MVKLNRSKIKNSFINIFLSILSISSTIFIIDICLKIVKLPAYMGRTSLITKLGIETDKEFGMRNYVPNSTYRHAAIFGDEIEYDYLFNTDANGFRLIHECSNKSESLKENNFFIAFTGDSFTEGQGAETSWTKKIQANLCNKGINSNNMAMAAYSVIDMEKTLNFAYEKLDARKAIIGLIIDDFDRGSPIMMKNKKCSRFVRKNSQKIECGELGSVNWWHINNDYDEQDLISFAKDTYQYGLYGYLKPYIYKFKNSIKFLLKKILPKDFVNKRSYSTNSQLQDNIDASFRIIKKFGNDNVLFILLPTTLDISNSKYTLDKNMNSFFKILNKETNFIDARGCQLNEYLFNKKDRHPNTLGQKVLGECISKKISKIGFFDNIFNEI